MVLVKLMAICGRMKMDPDLSSKCIRDLSVRLGTLKHCFLTSLLVAVLLGRCRQSQLFQKILFCVDIRFLYQIPCLNEHFTTDDLWPSSTFHLMASIFSDLRSFWTDVYLTHLQITSGELNATNEKTEPWTDSSTRRYHVHNPREGCSEPFPGASWLKLFNLATNHLESLDEALPCSDVVFKPLEPGSTLHFRLMKLARILSVYWTM